MNKYIIAFAIFLSSCILGANSAYYMPMTKRTINFGEEICRYDEYKDAYTSMNLVTYVKPCEYGKICTPVNSNYYNLYACKPLDEDYDNSGKPCLTKENSNVADGIDCTGNSCIKETGTCGQYCSDGQVRDLLKTTFTCVNNENICLEFKSDGVSLDKSYQSAKNKDCVEIELEADSNGKNYKIKKVYSNYIASIDDGKFIRYDYQREYCKSGYALFFFGNGQLANPDKDNENSEKMFLRCVTILGRDSSDIIKYTIDNGDEMYYDYKKLSSLASPSSLYGESYKTIISRIATDNDLKLKVDLFKDYKEKMDQLNCRETGCEEEIEVKKLKYFYENPEEYLQYKDEPQVVEYLIKELGGDSTYKPKYTSSNGSNSLNISYLMALLSLILLL